MTCTEAEMLRTVCVLLLTLLGTLSFLYYAGKLDEKVLKDKEDDACSEE